jgi:alcohol dehydrogenase
MLCVGIGFMPLAALIDYNLTLSVPPRTTADTGIDALTHAIEAYVSKKASLYSDSQALAAMSLLAPNLRRAYHNGADREAREAMMLGSTLAGVAFSNASVALVHGMSRPIGAAFHVPHGLSNAMLLPCVTAWSIPAAPGRYADCARAMGVATVQDSDEVANQKLLDELHALNDELQVPSPAQFGIDRQAFFDLLPVMAEQALASGSPGNNPRVPDAGEITELYKQLW